MKYNAPYGVSDPNAAYINGDPSVGIAGSIPPAASIEYPQREIANLITDAQLTPSNSDLHQLAKGVQSGRLIYGDDVGVVNQVSIVVNPPVLAYTKGMVFLTMFAFDNTQPAVASVSGLPFIPIIRPVDKSQLQPLDLRAGAIGALSYDAIRNAFQLVWSQTPIGSAVFLITNLDYYVGGPGANDANDGTTATVSGVHGPFATLQKAMNTIANYNLNGHNISIHIFTPGTYAAVRLSRMAGSGTVFWLGDQPSPINVVINGSGVSAVNAQNCGNNHSFRGVQVQASGTFTNDPMCGFNVSGTGTGVELIDISWGACATHLAVTQGAVVSLGHNMIINGNANGGNAAMPSGWHIYMQANSILQPNNSNLPNLNINGAYGGQAGGGFGFVNALSFGELFYTGFSGFANWGGIKYGVQGNAILNTHGGGASYLPGSVAGSVSTGGQYF